MAYEIDNYFLKDDDKFFTDPVPCTTNIQCCAACGFGVDINNDGFVDEPYDCHELCYCDYDEDLMQLGIYQGYCAEAGNGGTGGGGDNGPQYTIVEKCCDVYDMNESDPLRNIGHPFMDACNLFACGTNSSCEDINNCVDEECSNCPDGSIAYFHNDLKCQVPVGTFGPHNVVYDFYDTHRQLWVDNYPDNYNYYPLRNRNSLFYTFYYKYPFIEEENDDGYYDSYYKRATDTQEVRNNGYDKYQIGIDREGNVLYDLSDQLSIRIQDVYAQYGFQSSCDMARGFSGGNAEVFATPLGSSMTSAGNGIGYCGDYGLSEIGAFMMDNFTAFYFYNFFSALPEEVITDNSYTGNEIINIPNSENGYGLQWMIDDATYKENPYLFFEIMSTSQKFDIMNRIGFPLPPIALFGRSGNSPFCQGVDLGYTTLINEWKSFIGIGTFFSDFDLPGIKIIPTMKNELDVDSGIDLREDYINGCAYVQFLYDGVYYEPYEIPDEFIDPQYENAIRNFSCSSIKANVGNVMVRAVCKDNSTNTIITGDTGVLACNSLIETNTNQELYFLSDGDSRQALGIFFSEEDNKTKENFISNITEDGFNQYPLIDFLINGNGRLRQENINDGYTYSNISRTYEDIRDGSYNGSEEYEGIPYSAENFYNTQVKLSDGSGYPYNIYHGLYALQTDNTMLPYWSSRNTECFSLNKCIVMDTITDNRNADTFKFDSRTGMSTVVYNKDLPIESTRKNQQYKISFMMKTKKQNGVDLKDTGVHIVSSFFGDHTFYPGGFKIVNDMPSDYPDIDTTFNVRIASDSANSTEICKDFSNSQCSPKSHPNQLNGAHYDIPHMNAEDQKEAYCNKIRGSFRNKKNDTWEKMEMTFTVKYPDDYNDIENGFRRYEIDELNQSVKNLKINFFPLQVLQGNSRDLIMGKDNITTNYSTAYTINEWKNLLGVDFEKGGAKIYIDDIKFTEAFDFHPDVDVRKRISTNNYGQKSLTNYNVENTNDTTAPLQAQFYFYPRQSYDDIFSELRDPLFHEFKYEQFYIHSLDWGDGSPLEYINKPVRLGINTMLYHTYESSGIFKITGNMFQTKPESSEFDAFVPEKSKVDGNLGVGHNKNFTLFILINEGVDEDFQLFGSDGFSFIPNKSITPIIGGFSKNSQYYKSIKRHSGIFQDGNIIDVSFDSDFDKFKTQLALRKMDESVGGFNLDAYESYSQRINPFTNNYNESPDSYYLSDEYLETLPFPRYTQEYDINRDGASSNISGDGDLQLWRDVYRRPDIADFMESNEFEPGQGVIDARPPYLHYNDPSVYANPAVARYLPNYEELTATMGKSIGDCDISSVKYYNEPKSIWEMFGFNSQDENEIAKPDNRRYWKNIISDSVNITDREGLFIEGGYINTNGNHDWTTINPNLLNIYYYPVLPKYGANGRFVEIKYDNDGNVIDGLPMESNNIIKTPFPQNGPITNEFELKEELKINISTQDFDNNVLNDNSGNNNLGFIFSDYKPLFSVESLKVRKNKNINRLKKQNTDRAF